MATGSGQPVGAIVQQIAEWFIEQEDERAEGRLDDCLAFYCAQYLLPEPTRAP